MSELSPSVSEFDYPDEVIRDATYNHEVLANLVFENSRGMRINGLGLPFSKHGFKSTVARNRRLSSFCIVERTMYIPYFASKGSVMCHRPRRFGKTWWLETLESFYSHPETLEGTWIYSHKFTVPCANGMVWCPGKQEHTFVPCPVLYFDFSKTRARYHSIGG